MPPGRRRHPERCIYRAAKASEEGPGAWLGPGVGLAWTCWQPWCKARGVYGIGTESNQALNAESQPCMAKMPGTEELTTTFCFILFSRRTTLLAVGLADEEEAQAEVELTVWVVAGGDVAGSGRSGGAKCAGVASLPPPRQRGEASRPVPVEVLRLRDIARPKRGVGAAELLAGAHAVAAGTPERQGQRTRPRSLTTRVAAKAAGKEVRLDAVDGEIEAAAGDDAASPAAVAAAGRKSEMDRALASLSATEVWFQCSSIGPHHTFGHGRCN